MDDDDGRFNKKRKSPLRRLDLVLPELSYQIVGSLFEVSNELGAGHLERVYQRATAMALQERGIAFREQVRVPLQFSNTPVGWYQLDFLIEDAVVLELKQGERFKAANIKQVNVYLQSAQKPLAILANFCKEGVLFKRILNESAQSPHS